MVCLRTIFNKYIAKRSFLNKSLQYGDVMSVQSIICSGKYVLLIINNNK